jgi:predicted ATPase
VGFTLTEGAWIYDHLNEPDEQLKRAAEAEQLARENSLSVFVAFFVPVSSGIASIRKAQFASGAKSLKTGISIWEEIGGRLALPYLRSVLAYGTAQAGDVEGALCLVDEVVEQIERPGWGERWYYAETLRIKGWLLSLGGDLEGAERNFLASLDWARRQQAKMWELRTSTSLARLWQSQGKRQDAYDLLAPVYSWFTEGFDTKDLQDAKSLLAELG